MKQGETMESPVIIVAGTRPNVMKTTSRYAELERRGVKQLLLHTGQHYDEKTASIIADIIR